jgi:LCP family protein required for cell wall assembly
VDRFTRLARLLALALAAHVLVFPKVAPAQPPAVSIHKTEYNKAVDLKGGVVRILLIGSDRRRDGSVEGQRADSLHVVSYNTKVNKASVISIPRDTYVEIPSRRAKDRINAALEYGGPQEQVKTVSKFVGFDIDYFVMVDFDGFVDLVNKIGGVTVVVPEAMSDPKSGANFPAGKVHLDGDRALAFARNRAFVRGDFDRTENQTRLLLYAFRQIRAEVPGDMTKIVKYMGLLSQYVDLDLPYSEAFRLAMTGISVDPATVQNYTVTGSIETVGGASVVMPSGNSEAFKDIADDGLLTNPGPSLIKDS